MIIGLCGKGMAGKSYAAKKLSLEGFERVRVIEAMKQMMRGFFRACDLPEHEIDRRIEGDLKETPDELLCGKTPRYAMQALGTEWGRALIGEYIWTNSYEARLSSLAKRGKSVVTEDIRFDDEAHTLSKHGGFLVEIQGLNAVKIENSRHLSEVMENLTPDFQVVNDGVTDTYVENIKSLVFTAAQTKVTEK